MDPTEQPAGPSVSTASMSAPNTSAATTDPLVTTWFRRIEESKKHWSKFHERVRYNRKLVRGIDEEKAGDPKYNVQRANLISATLTVVLSKVYAKNPEMSGEATNKAEDLALFVDTVSRVTQAMLESAKLKKQAKRAVKAAMLASFGVVKLQYQKDRRTDPIIQSRIKDAQDNVARIESLLATLEDPQARADQEATKRELEETIKSLQAQPEVVAAEGLVMDRVPTDRLLIDPAVEDFWDFEAADWMVEIIPMRKSKAQGLFPGFDLSKAATYTAGKHKDDAPKRIYSATAASGNDDPIIQVYEGWSEVDNKIYTLVDGCTEQFARAPYNPEFSSERWWPYHALPFQSVDGCFTSQSLVDAVERLQEEHNETRDKFAEVRRNIRPHHIASSDLKDKDIEVRLHPAIGEIVVVKTDGGKLADYIQQANQLTVDPAVFDTAPIRNDWEQVSGLQDAARSVVVQAKTATEASISDQSLAARVAEFRDQVEDFLTDIAQAASELCLLAMTPQQVETIMGKPQMDPSTGALVPTYFWPEQRSPETVFNLIQMKIRAGSTAAPNKLAMQESWTRAMPLLQQGIQTIRQLDAMGADSTPERELLKETAARFDETIDVERFLPPKPIRPAMPALPGMPGAQPPIPGAVPAGLPTPGGPALAAPTTLQ